MSKTWPLLPGYQVRQGSELDEAVLVTFMQRTYQELCPNQNFSHLHQTVAQYLSEQTPLWWVEVETDAEQDGSHEIGCLWLGSAVDQLRGDRHTHVFLLYVASQHRRRGIGSALMHQAEEWAKARGEGQVGLQVFQINQAALAFYQHLGYATQAYWMTKPLATELS